MSVRIMGQVLDLPFKVKHKLIMIVLANYANDDGENAYPSLTTQHLKSSISRPAVIKGLSDLRADLVIKLERRGGSTAGGNRSSRYLINVQLLHEWGSNPQILPTAGLRSIDAKIAAEVVNQGYHPQREVVNHRYPGGNPGIPDPSLTMNDHGWMEKDPICSFLSKLPGFNPGLLEETRREVLAHHYDPGELPYLWNECALGENPIGLFVHRIKQGQRSIDWQMRQLEHAGAADLAARSETDVRRTQQLIEARAVARRDPDQSVTVDRQLVFEQIKAELSIDASAMVKRLHIEPARLLSVNSRWLVGVTDPSWWQRNHLATTLDRISAGVAGASIPFIFVKDEL